MAFFPRREGRGCCALRPGDTQSASQQSDFDRWYASAPRTIVPVSNEGATVLIVKFTDYPVPRLRADLPELRPILAKVQCPIPGSGASWCQRIFPLDTKCNLALARFRALGRLRCSRRRPAGAAGHRDGPLEDVAVRQSGLDYRGPTSRSRRAGTKGGVESSASWRTSRPGMRPSRGGIKSDVALAQSAQRAVDADLLHQRHQGGGSACSRRCSIRLIRMRAEEGAGIAMSLEPKP